MIALKGSRDFLKHFRAQRWLLCRLSPLSFSALGHWISLGTLDVPIKQYSWLRVSFCRLSQCLQTKNLKKLSFQLYHVVFLRSLFRCLLHSYEYFLVGTISKNCGNWGDNGEFPSYLFSYSCWLVSMLIELNYTEISVHPLYTLDSLIYDAIHPNTSSSIVLWNIHTHAFWTAEGFSSCRNKKNFEPFNFIDKSDIIYNLQFHWTP